MSPPTGVPWRCSGASSNRPPARRPDSGTGQARRAQTEAVLPVILVACLFLRRDLLLGQPRASCSSSSSSTFFSTAHWCCICTRSGPTAIPTTAWVTPSAHAPSTRAGPRMCSATRYHLGGAVILSGAGIWAVTMDLSTFNTVAVHSGRIAHCVHHPLRDGQPRCWRFRRLGSRWDPEEDTQGGKTGEDLRHVRQAVTSPLGRRV